MKPEEREMIYEINLLRTNPSNYVKELEPMLVSAIKDQKEYGNGSKRYSLTYTTKTLNGKKAKTVDTTWFSEYGEMVKALNTLIDDLKKLKPMRVLKPDSGIYNATKYFGADQKKHNWNLLHTGSDGSSPSERIMRFSPKMKDGNENIAGALPNQAPRAFVMQLLIADGIPGYGHRYNIINPKWTYVACYGSGLESSMYNWIQNFGVK
ncbi:MAG: hypothetical protein SGJ10_03975 [Bacteroidota bacterium]|nr:hypothetical protein [Bacteroidota bacterium]